MSELVYSRLDRVRNNTAQEVNARIDAEIMNNVRSFESRPAAIDLRIKQLDAEWSLERILDLGVASLAFVGILLGALASPWWLLLPALLTGILLQQAVQGWCPLLPSLRRLGKRTRKEIDTEKFALKALRGDFTTLVKAATPTAVDVAQIVEVCSK